VINKDSKIYIAGHRGMVGSSCWRVLRLAGYKNIIGKSSKELDLRNQTSVFDFINNEKPDVIVNAAAKVGGILANHTYPYEFLMDNMLIQNNLIQTAHKLDVSKFIFLGSSCIYPKFSKQPIKEKYLLTDELEETNQWYAIAKISGVKLIESLKKQYKRDYVSLMPTNLYGPNDNYDLNSSHVIPAMLRKFHDAKINNNSSVELWGSGTPKREFLYVDDLANAVLLSITKTFPEHLYNVGSGIELTIKELALKIQNVVGYKGKIIWNKTMPDGTPRKLIDSSKIISQGYKVSYGLDFGLKASYESYINSL
jgi:GDP-L-fucose synthase